MLTTPRWSKTRPKGRTAIGNKSDKLKEEALRRQNEAYQQQFKQQVAEWKPSPYEEALNHEGIQWLNATSGKEPLDVSKLPGMAPYIDIFNTAVAKQKGRNFGLGMMGFGAASANPSMLAALAQQEEAHRRQDAAAQLNQAYAIRNAEVRGSALPLISIGENRAGTKVGATAGMAANANNAWANHRVPPGFWATMLNNVTQGAGQGSIAALA